MGILDQITQMRMQGMTDDQIVESLKQQGISPKQIQDAVNQEQIKNAVNSQGEFQNSQEMGMEPSIMQQEAYAPQQGYDPSTQQQYNPQQPQEYYPQQDFQGQQYQEQFQDYTQQPQIGLSTDTIIEIAEQVFSEKIKKLQKQVEELVTFKTLSESKLETISDRLKRVEATVDKMQVSIMEKVGEYSQDIRGIRKEMEMVEDSFTKMLSSKTKHSEEKPKTSHKIHSKKRR